MVLLLEIPRNGTMIRQSGGRAIFQGEKFLPTHFGAVETKQSLNLSWNGKMREARTDLLDVFNVL